MQKSFIIILWEQRSRHLKKSHISSCSRYKVNFFSNTCYHKFLVTTYSHFTTISTPYPRTSDGVMNRQNRERREKTTLDAAIIKPIFRIQRFCLDLLRYWATSQWNNWVLHIAKVVYFFSPSLPNVEWPILGPSPFSFYQKFFIFHYLENCFWGPILHNTVG